jgi:hypothetical protein
MRYVGNLDNLEARCDLPVGDQLGAQADELVACDILSGGSNVHERGALESSLNTRRVLASTINAEVDLLRA